MPDLKLCELISLAGVSLTRFKIHCATGSSPTPLVAFFNGQFKRWQEHQHQRNFQCDQIVSLIHLAGDRWLFAGVWTVLGVSPSLDPLQPGFMYSTQELPGLDHLTGRAVVRFDKSFRASYLRGERYSGNLNVIELLAERMTIGDFPGFSAVSLSIEELNHVVTRSLPGWRAALASVAGVYVILDQKCGKLYVGSAYGDGGIWGRWSAYVSTGHGGNVELRDLLMNQNPGYSAHFRFSILEICDILTSRDAVLERESHWKTALGSRAFGYNSN